MTPGCFRQTVLGSALEQLKVLVISRREALFSDQFPQALNQIEIGRGGRQKQDAGETPEIAEICPQHKVSTIHKKDRLRSCFGLLLYHNNLTLSPLGVYHGIRLRKDADPEPTEDIYQSTPLLTDSVNDVNDLSTIKYMIVDGIDQPLAHSHPVNGHQKTPLTIVDRSLTMATKGKRDERCFHVICTIEGCTRPNTNGGNAMCDEHWQAHKKLMLIRAKSQPADITEVEKDRLTD